MFNKQKNNDSNKDQMSSVANNYLFNKVYSLIRIILRKPQN
jgi:hypothetical protein